MGNKNLKNYLVLLMLLFSFTLVSAQGCADTGWKGYGEISQNKTIKITCTICDYINFTAINTSDEMFLNNVQMEKSGSTFSYTFMGSDLDSVGTYWIDGFSNLDTPLALCFDITPTGDGETISYVIINIILLVILFGITIGINTLHRKTDFDSWDKDIINKHKNMGQTLVNGIVYSLFKNVFIWYYSIGWIFILVLKDAVYRFNSEEIYGYFTLLANVYSLGFLLVTVFMIGYFASYMKNTVNILTDNNWGIEK